MEGKEVLMTDDEFIVLDELYFVISFDQLISQLDMPEAKLVQVLFDLYRKGWIRIQESVDVEVKNLPDETTVRSCYFLASKKGLQAHNS